ncbi:serine hydrolase domain-containing protein [Occallatibacter riparius]|uniref:Beta-lactamase family protein n=1 Tax=Occallatibacter riparius TaxID=1002689 RepID=A0A9J7BXI1_9BACT|nr:serine hydrolase domain-containing protein [Occallatibacter riparius]UWZ85885.1 beta-lactamase family protein [Occallatibacter riparius]
MPSRFIRAAALAPVLFAASFTSAQKPAGAPRHNLDMTLAKPESVGFDSQRLERLHAVMQKAVDDKKLAGVVTILARHGKVADYRTYGTRDMASNTPMTKDTIFRDYSMTKPVTAVAMMVLFEEGKWLPNDPIAKYIPEFAHLKVYAGKNDDGTPKLVDPDHQPTMAELMSHTAGFTYGLFGNTPVDKMVRDAKLFESKNLQEFIDKTATLPLLYQPGKGWTYSISMDIEGYIVEKLSGQSLPDFYRDHIYQPLGMKDAGFYVPKEKWQRFATVYYHDPKTGGLTTESNGGVNFRPFNEQPPMPSGGGGMVSTAEDYYRFAQMLGDQGELNGHRILAPATVKLMTTNHVPEPLMTMGFGIGSQQIRPGFGYGYNGAVEYDPHLANLPDGKGTYLWDGAAGTWFWVDPTNDIVFVGMIQRIGGGEPNVQYLSRSLVYQALTDPSK